jgi:HK97 family phage prohead protease
MPMKPRKGESQSDFMKRCMHETYGADAPEDRTQEQAVAICMNYWRDAKGGKKPKSSQAEVQRIIRLWCAIIEKQADIPEPEEGESKADFMDRCTSELDDMDDPDAEDACELAWEDYQEESSGTAGLVLKEHVGALIEDARGLEFILSDATPDRFGDVVEPKGWQYDNFKRHPIALFNHNADFPIGTWANVRNDEKDLRARLVLAPKGTSARLDEIRALVDAKILKAVSVGFKAIKSEALTENTGRDPFGFGPKRYLQQELVECSLVSIPANPNALAVAKSLKISSETQRMVFGEHADRRAIVARRGEQANERRSRISGANATSQPSRRSSAMTTLAERIKDTQADIVQFCDNLDELLEKTDQNASDKDMEAINELNTKIAARRKLLAMLEESEKNLGDTARNSDGGNGKDNGHGSDNGRGRALMASTAFTQNGRRNGTIDDDERERRRGFFQSTSGKKELQPLDYMIRAGVVTYLSKVFQRAPEDICRAYPPYSDEKTRAAVDWMTRAAANPAMTTVTGWAAELVQTIYGDFMELLMPTSIFPRLSAQGLALQFGRAGRISIPTRAATPTISGSFVGEGMPIPVRQGQFVAQILTPKKMAVITTWTRELDLHSIPAIEGLLRQAVQEDTAVALDSILVDTNPATTIRPAGLFNGVTPITATALGGNPFNAIVTDLKNLSGALIAATKGNIRNPVFLMNPGNVNSAKFIVFPVGGWAFKDELNRGQLNGWPVIDSGTMPLNSIAAVDAADFVSVGEEAPRFEVSDTATLHEEDTNPQPITGGTPSPATPVRSLWQTDSLALRLIYRVNWTMRRTGMVALINGVTW